MVAIGAHVSSQPSAADNSASAAVKMFVAGGMAGVISKTVIAPVERTKILTQIEYVRTGRFTPISQLVTQVFRNEGLMAFWKGNLANCVRIIPNKGILFACNDTLVRWFTVPGEKLSDLRRLGAGSASGFLLIVTTYPLDITQTRLSSGAPFKGIGDCLMKTAQAGGVRGLYAGFLPSVLGVVPYTGVQFLVYDKLKEAMRDVSHASVNPWWQQLVAGAGAGAIAQSISYPLDTIRRQMQVVGVVGSKNQVGQGRMRDYFTAVWQAHGIKGFYRGALLNVARAGPSQAIQFLVFDEMKHLLQIKPRSASARTAVAAKASPFEDPSAVFMCGLCFDEVSSADECIMCELLTGCVRAVWQCPLCEFGATGVCGLLEAPP